jgi:hypothetical protein
VPFTVSTKFEDPAGTEDGEMLVIVCAAAIPAVKRKRAKRIFRLMKGVIDISLIWGICWGFVRGFVSIAIRHQACRITLTSVPAQLPRSKSGC